jgi:hypothetical protein
VYENVLVWVAAGAPEHIPKVKTAQTAVVSAAIRGKREVLIRDTGSPCCGRVHWTSHLARPVHLSAV